MIPPHNADVFYIVSKGEKKGLQVVLIFLENATTHAANNERLYILSCPTCEKFLGCI